MKIKICIFFQVVFYSSYCLDIYVCSENYIKVRDAAISLFNQGKAMEEIQPIPFIKNFLLRYVDEAALQRRYFFDLVFLKKSQNNFSLLLF